MLASVTLAVVAFVTGAQSDGDYRRFAWPDWDGDGLNTRHEILAERCIVLDADRRGRPRQVRCLDQYTGEVVEGSARRVHIDHRVAWSEVFWRVPREYWGDRMREIYADPRNLVVTAAGVNLRKSNKDWSRFCAPLPASRPWHARGILEFRDAWGLRFTEATEAGISAHLRGECAPPD